MKLLMLTIAISLMPQILLAQPECKQNIPELKKDLLEVDSYKDQIDIYQSYYKECINNSSVNYNLALLYYKINEYEEAKKYLDNILKEDSYSKYLYALNSIKLNQIGVAKLNLKSIIAKNPKDKSAVLTLVDVYNKERDYENSESLLRKILDFKEDDELLLLLAQVKYFNSDYYKAKEIFLDLLPRYKSEEDTILKYLISIDTSLKKHDSIASLKQLYPNFFIKYPEYNK